MQFAALDPGRSAEALVNRGIEPELARRATTYASGSLGVAMKWIEDGVIEMADALWRLLGQLFKGQPPDDFPAWLKAAADAYAKKQIERDPLGSEDQARREGIGLYLHLAGEACRRRLAMLASVEPPDGEAMERICQLVDALLQAERYIEGNVNVSLVFQQLAVAMDQADNRLTTV